MTGITFTPEGRQQILGQYFPAYQRWQALDYRIAVGTSAVPPDLVKKYDELDSQLIEIRHRYRAGLPVLPLSRCPFTAQVMYHSLDPFGTDGLWWNYEVPVRPVENLPSTVHAITGALKIQGPPAPAPFLCMPGPGVPYVLPAILSCEPVTAVLSSYPVGNHTAYLIVYYTRSDGGHVPRADSWGMDHWEIPTKDGTLAWGEGIHGVRDADFELASWIEKKKLLWIQPGDPTVVLQSGTKGCPYIGLEGPRALQRVREGAVYLDGMEE